MIKAKIKMMLKNVGEKLVYMSDKLCNVKTVTVTGTTNGNGAFSLASVANYKNGDEVLSVATNTDANALCIPWVYAKDNWYVSVIHWQSWAQKANTSFTFTVRYKVGGVLRNLSIFKAFRHFMLLQKGGGVDGQTGYKGITLQGSRKADQHRNGIHRKLDRVLFFCEPSTSDADTHTAGGNVHIAGSYTADEHCVILSELQYKSSAIQGGGRSGLFPYGGNSHRASRRIPAKLGINSGDVFILGKGFNNRYPNCIAFSERRCAA